MATISSPGIGSGLDVQGIVSQLVALEKAPLKQLQSQATAFQTKLSTYGTIKSQVAAMGEAAAKLSSNSGWNAITATSSNPTAIGVSAAAGAPATSFTMQVSQLAKAQSTASTAVLTGSNIGSGSLTIQLGQWTDATFLGGSSVVNVAIADTDTLSVIASKINDAGAGVSATVLRDASGERLLLRSRETGEANGFRITAADADGSNTDSNGLSGLAFDASNPAGQTLSQSGQNALATVNNVPISSASNRLADTLPGMTIQLQQITTQPVEINVNTDLEAIKKNVQAFVDSYNTLNTTLASATRYDASTNKAGALQGDTTAVGLQNALRGMLRSATSSSPFERLSDIGIEIMTGGQLEVKQAKLDAALSNLDGIKGLFTAETADATTEGFGLKLRRFADGLLAAEGLVSNKTQGLQKSVDRNGQEQERVNDRANRVEMRLLQQYNAMDAAVGRLNGLNAFVSQQIALWNRGPG